MGLYVMELGATNPHVLMRVFADAVRSACFDASIEPAGKPPDTFRSLYRFSSRQRMNAVARMLERGAAVSARLDARTGGYALIRRPDPEFERSHWYGKLDMPVEPLLDRVSSFLYHPELLFVSLAMDAGLDLDRRGRVTPQTYPWADWRVITAAIRDHVGTWDLRNGDAHTLLTMPRAVSDGPAHNRHGAP